MKISEVLFSLLTEYRTYFSSNSDANEHDCAEDLENLERTLVETNFEDGKGHLHDWRNYVDDAFVTNWEKLSLEDRALLFYFAVKEADKEYWS